VGLAAADARPYGLGLLLVVSAMLALARFRESGSLAAGAAYAALAALTVYAHYMFATMLLVHVIFILEEPKRIHPRSSRPSPFSRGSSCFP